MQEPAVENDNNMQEQVTKNDNNVQESAENMTKTCE